MENYQDNIIISSLPKSGTNLITHIVNEITGLDINLPLSNKCLIKKNIKDDNVSFGGINKASKSEVLLDITFHDLNDAIYAQQYCNISDYLVNKKETFLLAGHLSPKMIMLNPILKEFSKKIYITRYGLDVLNSKMKFLENLDYIYALNKSLNNNEKYKQLRYCTPDKVLEVLNEWERYSLEYLDYKKEFYCVKYEKLLKNPLEEIKKLTNYLEIEVTDENIVEIVKKLFHKELRSTTVQHKLYRHYNKSKKTEGWKEYVPYSFYLKFTKKYNKILQNLNYQDKIAEYEATQQHEIFSRKLKLYNDQKNGNNFVQTCSKSFLETLNTYLKNKKIAIYADRMYGEHLIASLHQEIEIVLVCSDDYAENKNRVAPNNLLFKIMEFDYILIAAHLNDTEKIKKNIEKILRRHGGVEIIDGFNDSYYRCVMSQNR